MYFLVYHQEYLIYYLQFKQASQHPTKLVHSIQTTCRGLSTRGVGGIQYLLPGECGLIRASSTSHNLYTCWTLSAPSPPLFPLPSYLLEEARHQGLPNVEVVVLAGEFSARSPQVESVHDARKLLTDIVC